VVIGEIAGVPIPEAVVDLFGRRFTYVGLASRKRNGTYDLEAVRPREFIVEPGLLYRMDPDPRASKSAHHKFAQAMGLAVLCFLGGALAIGLLFAT
jgi:hypothetical protein